jgi:FixJ family two-component response regulator
MSDTPLVVIVDDDAMVRQSLSSLLRSADYEVKIFATAQELYDDADLGEADCLILDVRLPFISGLEFQHKLNERGVAIPIIFITGHGDIPMSVKAMKAGAADFLSKPFSDQEILDAVGVATEKGRAARGADRWLQEVRNRYEALSIREQQIMAMATAGLMNKQIAGELGLSEITVKIYRGKITRKMMAKTFADLVRMAQVIGLPIHGQ